MSYHDLSSCTLNAEERRKEADRLCDIIINQTDAPSNWTHKEQEFIEEMNDGAEVSVKQLFFLRDLKDKYL